METLKQTRNRYCSAAMTAAIVIGLGLIIADMRPMGKGLILGTLFSVFNFILMAQTLPMRMAPTKGKTLFYSLFSIFFRFSLMAVPLIIALKVENFALIGVLIGLVAIQIMILADHVLSLFISTRTGQV